MRRKSPDPNRLSPPQAGPDDGRPRRRQAGLALCLAGQVLCLALLSSCGSAIQQADLQGFIETGLSNVLVRSCSFVADAGALERIPSGRPISARLVIINPKNLAVAYSLRWNVADSLFSSAPETAPVPADTTHLSFGFVLDPVQAEHRTIVFSLGKYAASINNPYDRESFSVLCDSPPNPATRVATLMDSGQRSLLAIQLPRETSDDDLASLKITWTRDDRAASGSETRPISGLAAAPAANPFSFSYDCYYRVPDCTPGYGYAYTVTVVDAAGQESAAVGTSGTANSFFINYRGNGSTGGTAPAAVGYRFAAVTAVAAPGSLVRENYAFSSWNTAADGSGTAYLPGAAIIVPAGDLTLYAQWITNGTGISFDLGAQALVFSPAAPSAVQGSVLAVSCGNPALAAGGTDWRWYVDGVLAASGSPDFAWDTTGKEIGHYLISCTAVYRGIACSGSFRATVTQ